MKKFIFAALLAAVSVLASAQNPYWGFHATPITPMVVTPIIQDPGVAEHTEFWDRQIGTQDADIRGWSDGDTGFNGPSNSVFAAWLAIYSTTAVAQPDPGGDTISKRSEATCYWTAKWNLSCSLSPSIQWQTISTRFDSRLQMVKTGPLLYASGVNSILLRVWYIKQDSLSVGLSAYAVDSSGNSLSGASGSASCINTLGHSISAYNDWYMNTGWKPSKSDAGIDPFNFDKLPSYDSHVKFQDVILYYTGDDANGNRQYASRTPLSIVSDQMDATSAANASAPPQSGGGGGSTGGTGTGVGLRSLAPRDPFQNLWCSIAPTPQVHIRVRVATSNVYSKEWMRVFAEAGIQVNPKVTKGQYMFADGNVAVQGTTVTLTDSNGTVVYQNDASDVAGQEIDLPAMDDAASGTYTVSVSAPGYITSSATVVLSGTDPVDFGTVTLNPIIPPHGLALAHRRVR
jgi:hypothetical protein